MNLFTRKPKKISTPEGLLLAQHPELAGHNIFSRRSHIDNNYDYVFVDSATLPVYVVCLRTGTVEEIHEGESARVCLMRTLGKEAA